MNRENTITLRKASEQRALRRRVGQMHEWFNQGLWERCFSLIDPALRKNSKIEQQTYEASLQAFKKVYGTIDPWYIRISLHLEGSSKQKDHRPFAYVYIIWQDKDRGFHMFRERWVKDAGRWFTRVTGLVPNRVEDFVSDQGAS